MLSLSEHEKKIYSFISSGHKISTDSRNIDKGDIFFAIKGENFDGNTFVTKALEKGAIIAVSSDTNQKSEAIIAVEDTLATLQKLALHHRMQFQIPVLGITGSNGKTTTKELIANVLQQKYKIHYTQGNLNNHIGVPLTLLSMKNDTEIAVIEMGANHVGEIDLLCKIALPDYGLITNIGKAHLEGFGSFENIIQAKTELYRHIEKTKGTVFLHQDNTILKSHCTCKNIISYGSNPTSNVFLCGQKADASQFLKLKLSGSNFKKSVECNSLLIGDYNLDNILAAAVVGLHFEVKINDIVNAIENYIPSNNRSQLIEKDSNTIIMDAYNANPTSMKLALENFIKIKGKSKVVILGDMLELGKDAKKEHLIIEQMVLEGHFDLEIFVGEIFTQVINVDKENRKLFKSYKEAALWLEKNPLKKQTVLVKGSRGIQLEKLSDFL